MDQRSSFLERNELLLTCVAVLISFVLGCCGYWQHYQALGIPEGDWNWTDVVYSTLRLFVLSASSEEGSSSWPLAVHIARFLAPISLAWAGGRTIWALLKDTRKTQELSRLKKHILVLGAGKTGTQLTREFLRKGHGKGKGVVHVHGPDTHIDVDEVHRYWALKGDATEQGQLRTARAGEAEKIIVTSGNDHQTIRVAKALGKHLGTMAGSKIPCYLEMSPDPGSPLHREEAVNHLSTARLDVRLFQPDRIAARRLIQTHPPHAVRLPVPDKPIHALVIGFEPLGKEVVKQLVRVCHYLDRHKVRVTIVAENADRAWKRFLKEVPALKEVADVHFRSSDPSSITNEVWDELQAQVEFDAAYITMSDPDDAFAVAIDARDGLGSHAHPAKIVLCGTGSSFLDPGSAGGKQVEIFDPEDSAWSAGSLLEGEPDKIAMDIHERYVRTREEKDDFGAKPADKNWPNLAEDLRDGNRDQADHIDIKLILLGHTESGREDRTEELQKEIEQELSQLDEEALEKLAEVEHRRWMASKALAGYTYGAARDDVLRHHQDMKPYEKLEDDIKGYDRDAIRNFPKGLLGPNGAVDVKAEG